LPQPEELPLAVFSTPGFFPLVKKKRQIKIVERQHLFSSRGRKAKE
jgi:hypothetical protein